MNECTENTENTENSESTENTQDRSFHGLGLNEGILSTLDKIGFTVATEIQNQTIPLILQGKDITAQAKTGSGKTLAFGLPAIQLIEEKALTGALILVPTRELAEQVTDEFRKFKNSCRSLQTACVIGGQSYDTQIRGINRGANAVIATPGRLLDLLKSGKIKNFKPDMLILDEADEMLNMGFIEDIKTIFTFLPEKRQTIFFSATFPAQIKRLAQETQTNPAGVYLNNEKGNQDNELIEQSFYVVSERERETALIRLIEFECPEKAIVFCRTKRDVDALQSKLQHKGIKVKALHGDMSQSERTSTIKQFKSGFITTLIATDVASRGIDVSDVSHVFNYHIPENRDRYTHRIGRTGRAGRSGKAITLTTSSEWRGHFFLRGLPKKNIKFGQVPTSEKVQERLDSSFIDKLKDTSVSSYARKFCEKIADGSDSFELLCKLYTLTASEKKVEGPSQIGLSSKDISFLLSRSGSSHRGGPSSFSNRRSFGRKPNSYDRRPRFSSSRPSSSRPSSSSNSSTGSRQRRRSS